MGHNTKMVEYNGQMVEAIDLTPTWEQAAGIYVLIMLDGSEEGKQQAAEDLMDMGKKFDNANRAISALRETIDLQQAKINQLEAMIADQSVNKFRGLF